MQTLVKGHTGGNLRTIFNANFTELNRKSLSSVKDFGAVGDGVTDDTAAFQLAIDYCEDNNISALYVPLSASEKYLLSSTIIISKGDLTLYSFGGKRLAAANGGYIFSTDADGVLFDYGNDTSNYSASLTILGIFFNGEIGQTCFKFSQANDGPHRSVVIRDCAYVGFNKALWCKTPEDTLSPSHFDIQDCVFLSGTYAFHAESTVLGLRFVNNVAEDGARIVGTVDAWVDIHDNMMESNNNCIDIQDTGGAFVNIHSNIYEGCSGDYLARIGFTNASNGYYKLGGSYMGGSYTVANYYSVGGPCTILFENYYAHQSGSWITIEDIGDVLPDSKGLDGGYRVACTTPGTRQGSTLMARDFIGQRIPATLRETEMGEVSVLAPHGITSTAVLLTSGKTELFIIAKGGATGDLIVVSFLMLFTDDGLGEGWNGSTVELYNENNVSIGSGIISGTRLTNNNWLLATFSEIASNDFTEVRTRIEPYAGMAAGEGCYIAGVAGEVYNTPSDYEIVRPLYPLI